MAEVRLEATSGGSLDKLEGELRDVERQLTDLQGVVAKLSAKPLDLPTDPAEADIKRLVGDLAKLENAFRRAQASVNFQRARNQIEQTAQSARRLANAEAILAARGKELIDFSRRLPPSLKKSADAMDRLERQTEQAEQAFRSFRATAAAAGGGISSLISSINGLRAGLAGFVAALGIQQIIRFGRALISLAADAVETKNKFDALLPGLRAFTGSTELAEEVADRLASTATRLKTPLSDLINPFLAIQAGGKEAGLRIGEINELFEASLLSARAFGKGATEVNRLLTGISQVAGKGVACVDESVEIRTSAGWLTVGALKVGDVALTMQGDAAVEAIHRYRREICRLMSVDGAEIHLTPNHRVLLANGSIQEARELQGSHRIPAPAGPVEAIFSPGHKRADVWCPSTETGTWLARKDDVEFFTGNSMEEFRQQIGEAIPNAIPALARGLGKTVPETFALISSGSLKSADALRALTQGFRELNEEAGLAQLDTLKGDLGAFAVASEQAQKVLADGLEPGLRLLVQAVTELIETNPELIEQLGQLGSAAAAGLGGLIEIVTQAREGWRLFGQEALATAELLDTVASKGVPGAQLLADTYRGLGNVLAGTELQAEETFQAIATGARVAALGSAKSAEEILEDFQAAFQESAEAAGIAGEDIVNAQRDVAARVGDIADESAKARALLEKQVVDEILAAGKVREETADRVARTIHNIEVQSQRARAELLEQLLEETKKAAAERIAAEEEAAAEVGKFLDEVVAKARSAGEERAAADAETASKIEQIERELQEKIQKLRDGAAEKLKNPKVDREKVARDLLDKIVELERNAAEKIRAENQRIADEAEKAAERRIKAEEKVQKALERSVESYRKIVDAIREAAEGAATEGGEAGGGGFEQVAEQIEEARGALGDFIVDLKALNEQALITDAGEDLAAGFARLEDILGTSSTSLDHFFEQGEQVGTVAEESASALRDQLVAALGDAATAAEGLSGTVQTTVHEILSRYLDLAEGGNVTRDDLKNLADELAEVFGGVGQAVGDDVEEIRQQLDSLGDAQDGAAESAEEAGRRMEEAPKGAAVVVDELAGSIGQVGEKWEEVGDGVERAGQRIERSEDGLITITDVLEGTAEAGAKAKEGLTATAEGAEAAAVPLQQIAEAVNALPPEIVPEGQPEQLRQLGAAAGEAGPQIIPLAEPIAQIAEKLIALAEPLPVIAAQIPAISGNLPELQASLAALLQIITENPVDLEGAASSLETIDTALVSVSQSTGTLQAILPDLQAALEPLFAAAKEAAEDDRLGKIAEAIEEMAQAAPQIPEPIQKLAASLKSIAEGRDETVEAIDATRGALENLSATELQQRLEALVELLKAVQEKTGELAADAEAIRTELESIEDNMPKVVFQLESLAAALTGRVLPAVVDVREGLLLLNEQLDAVPAVAEAAAASLKLIEELGVPAIQAATEAVKELRAELQAAREDARLLNEEMARMEVP